MSVFQLHDYWGTSISSDEEYDTGCMAIGNLDNSSPPEDKIVVGSQAGVLRVFSPTKADFRVEDLIHEEQLGGPILQIAIGRFIPNSPEVMGLAVLHPRKLSVFEFMPQGGQGTKAAYYTLSKVYEHNLGLEGKHFTAFNMLYGPFGGVKGKDVIMVQSMDGKLQFFDQSAEAFTRQIVDCLLPGNFLYLRRSDAFVTSNYANRVECYRYQVLVNTQAEIGNDTRTENAGGDRRTAYGLTAVRSAMVEWSVNLGETCMSINEGRFVNTGGSDSTLVEQLLILTEHSLFLLKDTGSIVQQRRLEKEPACLAVYQGGVGKGHNFALASRDHTLQIFVDFQLVWAVMLNHVPVQVNVAEFGGQRGLIVTIGDAGQLNVGYLGTKPPITAIGGVKRDLDYEKLDDEHRKLLQIIRDLQSDNKSEPNDTLSLRSQIPRTLDKNSGEDSLGTRPPEDAVRVHVGGGIADSLVKATVRVFVTYSGKSAATNVNITVNTPAHLYCFPSNIVLQQVAGAQSTPTILTMIFFANRTYLPSSLDAQIVATYTTPGGEPRICTHSITLPISLACKLRAASKSAPLKLTIDTEHPPQPLSDLFSDFIQSAREMSGGSDLGDVLDASGGAMALGFQFWAKPTEATSEETKGTQLQPSSGSIIVSKAGGRYRVQADSLPALYTLTNELVKRLTIRLREMNSANDGASGKPKFSVVSFSESIPLDPYFSVISEHFETRKSMQSSLSKLNDCAHQYRMIEKRLLARFKDRTPSPLAGLDVLSRESYEQLMVLGEEVNKYKLKIKRLGFDLESGSKLVALLSYLKFGMTPMEHQMLESYLCPEIEEGTEQGWEEIVDASLTYLLRTALAKNAKETALISHQMEMLPGIDKLTKHIGMVIDRLSKGARLIKLKAPAGASSGARK